MDQPDCFLQREFASLVSIRKELHSHPERSLEEVWTSQFVADRLRSYGITVHERIGGHGLVGVVDGTGPGPAVALRADMDALEIKEETGLPYTSRRPGLMHACGHDGHMAIVIGAGAELASRRDFRGTVYLVFQPAEELGGGAQLMIDDGLFDRFPARQIFGLHNWPDLPEGEVVVHDGPVMAGASDFSVGFHAVGGHAGIPHRTGDPILAGGYFVTGLQQAISRAVSPHDAAVATVASFQGGNTFNVIPKHARLTGTLRAFSIETMELLRERVETAARSASALAGCQCDVVYEDFVMPPVVNTARERDILRAAAAEAGVPVHRGSVSPTMAGDDFGVFLKYLPGAYAWLGNGGGKGGHGRLHQPSFDFNDKILVPGAKLLTTVARSALSD